MDEQGATYLSDIARSETVDPPRTRAPLPMYLIMVSGGIPGAMLRLPGEDTRLGRAVDNTYPLADGTISRHHASITIDPHGAVRLTDLASVNGTFLNGRRLSPNSPTRLQDGDKIQIGA